MSLTPGHEVELAIEKPAAGGRMIARHEGQVVLVLGGIPGERVAARIERADKRLAFARVLRVVEPSPDRRDPSPDLLCGGSLYAHIAYERQLALKAEVIADAFARLGRLPLESPVPVAGSPEEGYRMRARLHVRAGNVGFYREGTHELCNARGTRQLRADTMDAVDEAVRNAVEAGVDATAVEVSENMAADQRALRVELRDGGAIGAGEPSVADPMSVLTAGRATEGELRRRPASFFQGNRFLLPALVTAVLDSVLTDGEVLELYAGVGLFAVALAAAGRTGITAVEGDRSAGTDLRDNAAGYPGAIAPVLQSVEDYLGRVPGPSAGTIIVDPPRTGISREAMDAVAKRGATRVVYVSCDPATMARDARRLVDAGYRLGSLRAFDLFPNTPHVETVGVFDWAGSASGG